MSIAAHTQVLNPPEEFARGDFEFVVRRIADELALGADNSLFVGSGLEYASSRPYQPGDSIRLLNWRLTARTGKPFIKEHEALKRTCVYILVDTSASMAVTSVPLSKHGLAVWIAAAVGLVAQRRLSPAAIIGAGERTTRIVPSLLRNDLWRAIEPLRRNSMSESTRLANRLDDLNLRAERASMVLVISDLHDPEALDALSHTGQRHDCAMIHTIDPAETGPLRAGFFRGQEAETGTQFLGTSTTGVANTHTIRSDLARRGVDYLMLRTDTPFIAPLKHFLGNRGGFTRGRG